MPVKSAPLPTGQAAGSVLMAHDTAGRAWNPLVELGPLEVAGDSHIAEFGPTVPDYGIAQKIAGLLKPGIFRSCALGGSIHSNQDLGNGAQGDGGWAHIGNEFNRQEQSALKYSSTITASPASGVSSVTVTSISTPVTPIGGEWLVIGAGANTEIVQVSQVTAPSGSTITFNSATTKSHTSGDPIYHACQNEGYLAKSAVALLCAEGANDLGTGGPGAPPSPLTSSWQSGTFGSTLGASNGNTPFMHSLRFTIAQLRCSVIYTDQHPSVVYAASPGTWTSNAATSTASFPSGSTPFNGFTAGNYHTAATNGSLLSFSTAPDFPGGAVDIFSVCASAGQGALWDYSVSGATTVAMTAHSAGTVYDNRNIGLVQMNAASYAGNVPGSCIRITGLNAGVNVITLRATTINSLAFFLGWGIEAPIPPLVISVATSRVLGAQFGANFIAGPGTQYNRRTVAATGATVTAGHGTTASDVAFTGGTVALATAGTPSQTLAQINDTITLDKGNAALEETRRITGFTGSPATSCKVDANFVNAHTTAPMQIGLQDADYVGGGALNTADTQGALSVPGLAGCIATVCGEFDSSVIAVPLDPIVNGTPASAPSAKNFYADGVHYNDQGSGLIAAGIVQAILAHATSIPNVASATVPNKRTWQWVYGDVGASPATATANVAFSNSWRNVYSSTFSGATGYPRTGFYKDMRTRQVTILGAVINAGGPSAGSVIFQLPVGFRPSGIVALAAVMITSAPVYSAFPVIVNASGQVIAELAVASTSAVLIDGTFLAEA